MCTSLVTPKGATCPNNGEQTIWQKEAFRSAIAGKRCATTRGVITERAQAAPRVADLMSMWISGLKGVFSRYRFHPLKLFFCKLLRTEQPNVPGVSLG